MGYVTRYDGRIEVSPALNAEEICFLKKFAGTRRMSRKNGPYFVDGSGLYGQGHDLDVTDYDKPPAGQSGLWCGWVPTDDGTAIEWNGNETFYDPVEWMEYLIEHFLRPGALALSTLPFLQANHVLNGSIEAQGEEDDGWQLVVSNNVVSVVVFE